MVSITTPSTINVAIIYLFSSTTPKRTDGWVHDWNEAFRIAIKDTYLNYDEVPYPDFQQLYIGLSVEGFFRKYITNTWKWNMYEFRLPLLVEDNGIATEILQLWREEYPVESDQILSTNNVIFFIINGLLGLGGISNGTIVTPGIAVGKTFDPTRPFINIEYLRYLIAHEIMHLFDASDHYSPWASIKISDPPIFLVAPLTQGLMGDGYPPFGTSYNLNEMPYLDPYVLTNEVDWNHLIKQNFDRPYNFYGRYSIAHFYVNLSDTIEVRGSEVNLNGIKQITGDRGIVSYWGLDNLITDYTISRVGYIPSDGQLTFNIDQDILDMAYIASADTISHRYRIMGDCS